MAKEAAQVRVEGASAIIQHGQTPRLEPAATSHDASCQPIKTLVTTLNCVGAIGYQDRLPPHRDGNLLSFNITLSALGSFEGGGTLFHSLGLPFQPAPSDRMANSLTSLWAQSAFHL